jgi:hypothetical protein
LTLSDRVPDEKTIWLFREKLIGAELVDKLFDKFLNSREKANIVGKEGQMVDASFVEVPGQCYTVDVRKTYMVALEEASVNQNMAPFTDLLTGLVRKRFGRKAAS